jgi:Na+/H+ antiporter NhaD/arsenite permease-like protein
MCVFILAQDPRQRGWILTFAHDFSHACTTPVISTFMGFVSAAFLCPLVSTNIGATIILVGIMHTSCALHESGIERDGRVLLGAIYSVAIDSNTGACSYLVTGSLAGLLWRDLLADKGVHVSHLKFTLVNTTLLLMQITAASAIALGEVYWFV